MNSWLSGTTFPRLVYASFFGGPPLDYVSMLVLGGDLTVLIGPNGSGKSTALRNLSSNLLQPIDDPATIEGSRNPNADLTTLFVKLDREALSSVLADRLQRLIGGDGLRRDFPTGFPLGGWTVDDSYKPSDGWEDRAPIDVWRETLLASTQVGSAEDRERILSALADSAVIAVEPVHRDGEVRGYWCLDARFADLDPDLAAAVERAGLRATSGEPEALISTEAPVIAAPIGSVPGALIPTIVEAPQGVEATQQILRHGVVRHIAAQRQAAESDSFMFPAITEPGDDCDDASVWLVETEEGAFSINVFAWASLKVAEALVNSFLPPFVSAEVRSR